MAKIITLGEIMLRLSTPGNQRYVQAKSFDVNYGGGEANVAVCLSHFGHDASFVSKIPNNDIGESAVRALKENGVNTFNIVRGGNRLGIYYLETGNSMRASKVIYDRANSAIAEASIEDFDFGKIFEGATWFHFSGITPALSDSCAKITEIACKTAKAMGLTVSCDLNYRKKLWSKEKAQSVMRPLMQYVDVCIGNEEDAQAVLGLTNDADVENAQTDSSRYEEMFKKMKVEFGFKVVATTLRESYSASNNGWKACLYDGFLFYNSKRYEINPIVDRVGGGDSFSAGLIHGLLELNDKQKAVEFATACSALKQTIPGDFNQVSKEEVEALMEGSGNGRVQR